MKINFVLALTLFVFSFLGSTFLLFGYVYIETIHAIHERSMEHIDYGIDCMVHFILIFSIVCIISAIFTIIYTFDGKKSDTGDKEFLHKFFTNKIFLSTSIFVIVPFLYFLFVLILVIFKIQPFYDFTVIDIIAKWVFVCYFAIGIPIFFFLLKKNRKAMGIES